MDIETKYNVALWAIQEILTIEEQRAVTDRDHEELDELGEMCGDWEDDMTTALEADDVCAANELYDEILTYLSQNGNEGDYLGKSHSWIAEWLLSCYDLDE